MGRLNQSIPETLTEPLIALYGEVHSQLEVTLGTMVPEALPAYKDLEWRLDVEVLDHIVIGDQRYVSLKERGLAF